MNTFQDTFKELNLTQLEIYAEIWATKFFIEFDRIILFKNLNPRRALHEDVMGGSIPGRYLILLELSESAFKDMIQAEAEGAGILYERYDRLSRAIGQHHTILDPNIETDRKMLRDDNFHRVYKNKSDYIQDDWDFRMKDPYKDLPPGVKEEDGYFWVLYDSNFSIFNFIKKHKLRVFPTSIERDEDIERATWERHIEPIVENYNLKNSLGEKFEYKFFTHPKTITETEMYLMLRKTMDLCQEFPQDPKDEDRDNFLEKVMGKLKSDISEARGKDGKKVDLKDMFHTFLVGLFKKTKMRGSREYFHELPVFLALVDWEYAKNNVNKDTGKTNNIQKEAPEQRHKVFPCKPGTEWDDIKITLTGDDTVRVKTPRGEGVLSYHQLGLADKRSKEGKPTILWTLFKLFAKNNGFISPNTDDCGPKLPVTAKRLNKHLQKLFGIEESIYTDHYKKLKKMYLDPEIYVAQDEQTATKSQRVRGYRTKIFFSDQTRVVQPTVDMVAEDDSVLSIIEGEIEDKGSIPSKDRTDNVYR